MSSAAELERLTSRVRAATRANELVETAQVRLLGLDEVRLAAGSRWPRMREYVREGSTKIIASGLGPEDAVIPCGDGFLVVFANASQEAIQRRCAELHAALLKFYLGEEALKLLRADVERETVTPASLAGMVSQTDLTPPGRKQAHKLELGRFWPIWSIRHQTIAAHLCAPACETKSGRSRMGYNPEFVEKASHRERDYLDLDLCLLEQACAASEHNAKTPLGVSVHATTLQKRRSRSVYLDHLVTNASALRQRLFITVAEIEPGTPLISLTEWSNSLKVTCPRVAFDLHHNDRALSAIGLTGIWAAGYHLPPDPGGDGAQVRATLNELHAWCRTLHRQGIQPFINGFENTGLLDLSAYSELAFATGNRLWPSKPSPDHAAPPISEAGRQAAASP